MILVKQFGYFSVNLTDKIRIRLNRFI